MFSPTLQEKKSAQQEFLFLMCYSALALLTELMVFPVYRPAHSPLFLSHLYILFQHNYSYLYWKDLNTMPDGHHCRHSVLPDQHRINYHPNQPRPPILVHLFPANAKTRYMYHNTFPLPKHMYWFYILWLYDH